MVVDCEGTTLLDGGRRGRQLEAAVADGRATMPPPRSGRCSYPSSARFSRRSPVDSSAVWHSFRTAEMPRGGMWLGLVVRSSEESGEEPCRVFVRAVFSMSRYGGKRETAPQSRAVVGVCDGYKG